MPLRRALAECQIRRLFDDVILDSELVSALVYLCMLTCSLLDHWIVAGSPAVMSLGTSANLRGEIYADAISTRASCKDRRPEWMEWKSSSICSLERPYRSLFVVRPNFRDGGMNSLSGIPDGLFAHHRNWFSFGYGQPQMQARILLGSPIRRNPAPSLRILAFRLKVWSEAVFHCWPSVASLYAC